MPSEDRPAEERHGNSATVFKQESDVDSLPALGRASPGLELESQGRRLHGTVESVRNPVAPKPLAFALTLTLLGLLLPGLAAAQQLLRFGPAGADAERAVSVQSQAAFPGASGAEHPVEVDVALLRSAPSRLDLATPDGRLLRAALSHFEDRGDGDVLWSGRIVGASYDTVLLAVRGGRVTGTYGEPARPGYSLRSDASGLGAVTAPSTAGVPIEDLLTVPWCQNVTAKLDPDDPEPPMIPPPVSLGTTWSEDAPPEDPGRLASGAPTGVEQAQNAVTVALAAAPAAVDEDAGSAQTITVTATITAGSAFTTDQTILVSVGGGSATAGVDFAAVADFSITLAASATSGDATFSFTPTNDSEPEAHETVRVSGSLTGATVTPADLRITDDDQHRIDLLLLYTPSAKGELDMFGVPAEILDDFVDYVNLIWRNNAFPAYVSLVHVAALPRAALDNALEGTPFVTAMRADAEVLKLREEHGADLVFLAVHLPGALGLPCGLAYQRVAAHTTERMAPSGFGWFSVHDDCEQPGAGSGWGPWASILAHEIGHNLGLNHDPAHYAGSRYPPVAPYAFGHTDIRAGEVNVATIMSYGTDRSCRVIVNRIFCSDTFTREPFYSTARIEGDGGVIFGIADERENERAASLTLASTERFNEFMQAAPPANLTGTVTPNGGSVDVALTWDDVSSREAHYVVQYRVFGQAWQDGATLVAGVTGTTLMGLAPATRYRFRVAAPNAWGWTSYSYEWVTRTPGDGPPTPPGNLRATTPGSQLVQGRVDLTWEDYAQSETGFVVQYRELGAASWTDGPNLAADATGAAVTGLLPDQDYEFRVGATNSHGTAWSLPVTVRTDAPRPPRAPENLVGIRLSSTTVRLSWGDGGDDETLYEIQMRSSGGGSAWTPIDEAPRDAETKVVGGLPEGERLDFRVVALGLGGQAPGNVATVDLSVEPPGVPVLTAWVDRDSRNQAVARFLVSVEPLNGAAFRVEKRATVFGDFVWRRVTGDVVLDGDTDLFRAVAANAGGTRISRIARLDDERRTLVRAPDRLEARQTGPTQVRLTWRDRASDELWYRVGLSRDGGAELVYAVYPPDTTEATLVGLRPGSYEFGLTVANVHGGISPRTTSLALPPSDPPPPAAASGLTAGYGPTATEATLSWNDNSSDETGFRVGSRPDDGPWTFIDVAADQVTATVSNLRADTIHHFRVLAESARGSFESNLATLDLQRTPRPPTGLRVRADGSTSVVLDWKDEASNETGFRIEYRQGTGSWVQAGALTAADAVTAAVTGLQPSTGYGFRVVALNAAGENATDEATLTTPPAAPSNLQASASSATSADLTWTDNSSDETGFLIQYRASDETGWTTWEPDPAANAVSVTIEGLVPGSDYEFRAFALGDHGRSSPSNAASASNFPRLPEAASELRVSFLDSHACSVSWTDNSSDETGFLIQYRLVGRTEWDTSPAFPADATAGTVSGLLPSRTYRFRVLASNANGARPSYQREATSPPAAPTELTASRASGTSAALEWKDNALDASGFVVEERQGSSPWYSIGTIVNPRAEIGGVKPFVVLEWRVRAFNDNGVSGPSNVVTYVERSAPPAPVGLTAVATGSTSVDLSWVDNSEVEAGFRLERRETGGTTWTAAGAAPPDTTRASLTGLAASTGYAFRVVAWNANGVGESDSVSLTMPPAAPTGLSATQTTPTSAQLSWTDNAVDETGNSIQYSDGSMWLTGQTTGADGTSVALSGLTAGAGYEFRVLALNANGNSSPSNVVGLGPALAPPAPSGLVAAASGSTGVNLTWSDGSSNETGFKVEVEPSGGAWTTASTTPPDVEAAAVTGLTPSAGYRFRVTATNANGASSSGVASLVMPPAAPTGLSARAASATAVDLAWTDAASDESGFLIEYRRQVDPGWTAWGTRPAANATAASVTGLRSGTAYLFRVRAVHSTNGASTPSNVAETSTSGTRVPTGLRVVATGSTSASASWEDESHDETGFVLEHRPTGGDWSVGATVDVDVESATLTNLLPSTTYEFRVGAVNSGGAALSGTVSLAMPPAAPTDLEATAASATSARLAWTDASSDETSFVIQYREESASDWTLSPSEAGADATAWTATGLEAGKAYVFRIYAKHSTNGLSSPSNEARTSDLGAPRAPSGLAAMAAGSTTLNLTWTDNASDETDFLVEYRSGAETWMAASSTPPADAESATVTGLRASRGYEFRVSARNARGAAASGSATVVMPPAPPTGLQAAIDGETGVLVTWEDASEDETGYALEYRQSSAPGWTEWSASLPTNPTSALVTGLTVGGSYEFRAFAMHVRNGRSSPSGTASLNMVGAPEAPSRLVATAVGSTDVRLHWIDNSANETAFVVEQRVGSGPWSTAATNGPDVNWALIKGLAPSTEHGFRVAARNANGQRTGPPVTLTMPPAAPTDLVATEVRPGSDDPGVRLTWTDNATDERDFLVEYRGAGEEAWSAFSTRPPADSTSFETTELAAGGAYEFRVLAISRHGNSSPSNVASVGDLGVPEAPTDFGIIATGSTTALATWTDSSTKEAVFRVQRRSPGAEEWIEAALANRNETSVEVPDLLASTAYEFRVVSWTVSGSSGSNVATLTMPPAPPVDLVAGPASPTSVTLRWTDASLDETSFVVEYKRAQRKDWNVFATEAATNATSLTVTGLASGLTWEFRVYAKHNANGRSSPSNVARVRRLGAAGVPADVAATASGSTSAVLTWTDNGNDETGFRVEYRVGRRAWAGTEVAADSTTATVTGLLPSTSYEFRVSSLNAHGAAASDSVFLVMPPAAPTGLTAAQASSTSVSLAWTDASTDEDRFVAEYREAGTTAAWTAFGTNAAAGAESITVTGLVSGRSYEFRVFAENGNGRSSPSGAASVASGAAPAAPSGVTATAQGSTTALVAWSDNSSDETGFEIEYRAGSGPWQMAARTTASVTRTAVAGLEPATAYEFRVSATNGNGSSAAAAAPVLTMPPAAPTALTATRTGPTGVTLTWTDNSTDETSFVIEYKTLNAAAWSAFGEAAADATSTAVTGLATGTSYAFRVFAKHSANGLSTPSHTVSVGALGAPAPPTGLTAAATASTVVALSWTDASSDETGFRVDVRRAAAGVPWTLNATLAPDTTTATVTGLVAGAAYEFRVGAENTVGVSWTAVVGVRTPADSVPTAPTGLVVAAEGPTRVRLTWNDQADNEANYVVRYRFGGDARAVWSIYPADQQQATLTGLASGQYTFDVQATNAAGGSATALASWTLPRPRPNPPKAAAGLKVKLTGPYTAELRWKDKASDETEYLAAIRPDDGAWEYASSAADSTRGFFHGLAPGKTYHARVIAYHEDNGGLNSNVVTFENPAAEPRAPRDVTITPTGSTSLVIAWNDVSLEETGYEVLYQIVENDPEAVGEAPWTTAATLAADVERLSLDRLFSSTTYRFAVWTVKNGKRESSEVVELTMPPPPPTGTAARAASTSSAEVSWRDASTDETGFLVEYRASGATVWTAFAREAAADGTALVVTGLAPSTGYDFRVFARHRVNGLSSPSNEASATTADESLTIGGLSDGTVAENSPWASAPPTVAGATGAVTWTLEGVDASDFTIDGSTGVVSMAARDFEAPADDDADNVYAVTVKATDAGGVVGTASLTVTVTNVNEAPAFTTSAALVLSVMEGTSGAIGSPVSATDPEGGTITYTLTGADASSFAIDSATGQLSVGTGTTLNHEQKASYGFSVVATDDDATPLSASRAVTVNVSDVDESLTIGGLSNGTVAENAVYASATPTVTGATGTVTWTVEGVDASDFTIDGSTGALSMVARDFEAPADDDTDNVYAVTVKATDADGIVGTAALTVTVTNVNEAPAFATSAALVLSVMEGASGAIGSPVSATDPEGDAIAYTLTGADASSFAIDSATGQLSVGTGTTLNHEQKASYGFDVVATDDDATPLSASRAVTVNVSDVDESLTIGGLSNGTVAENAVYASATPTVAGATGTVTWTVEGVDASDFTIDGSTGALSMVARDFEAPADDNTDNVYAVTVKATDADGIVGTAALTVTVTNVNEAPAFATSAALVLSVAEGTSGAIGSPVSATDPEGGTIAYTLTGADASSFAIDSATGQLSVGTGTTLNHEQKQSYGFTVVATDDDATPLSASRAVTVNVTDVDESLTIGGLSNGTVAENSPWASATPTVAGATGAVAWTLEGVDASDFTIDGSTGALSMVARDFEAPADDDRDNVYAVTVKATDANGIVGTAALTVTVTNVNEAPVFATSTALVLSVAEGTSGAIGSPVSATDPEADAIAYSLTGADAASFAIDSATGQLSVGTGTTLNHEQKASYGFNVVATDDDASPLSASRAVTVNVADADVIMPPASPSGVAATPQGAASVLVTWTDNSSNETGFVVEYREARTEAWTAFGTETLADATSVTVTGLTAGRSYDFRVIAKHATIGLSSPSEVKRAGAFGAPAPPTDLTVSTIDETSVRLEWTDESTDETGFEIEYRETNPGVWRKFETDAPANATSIVVTGLAAGTRYDFRVIAKSDSGLSTPSLPRTETTTTPPPFIPPNRPPTFDQDGPLALTVVESAAGPIGSVSATDPDGDRVSYGLGGPDARSFRVDPDGGVLSLSPRTSLDASRKDAYAFSVTASDGRLSAILAVTLTVVEPERPGDAPTALRPAPPSELEASLLTSDVVVLSWRDNADDETGFEVFRREDTGDWESSRSLPADTETATMEDLAAGIEYEFAVTAKNVNGSTASNVASAELSLAPPTRMDAAPRSETSARVTWRDNSVAEAGFEVQVRFADTGDGDDGAGEGGTAAAGWTLGAAVGPNATEALLTGLTPGGVYRFRVAALNPRPGGDPALSAVGTFRLLEPPSAGAMTDCEPGRSAVTLGGDYEVAMCFETPSGAQMDASNYHLESTASGLLYFFDRDNVEVLVKVLDGCAINGHRWVFVAPVTTLAFSLEITERSTGRRFAHRNPKSLTAETRADTAAFPCEPEARAAAALNAGAGGPIRPRGASENAVPRAAVDPSAAAAAAAVTEPASPICEPEGPGILLEDGHRIDMCFEMPNGEIRQARDWGLTRRSTALLYFFDRENAEVLVKVLDGCAVNGRRWVFAAPVTDLAFHLVVTDPAGRRWTHSNEAGRTAPPGSDTAAFRCD